MNTFLASEDALLELSRWQRDKLADWLIALRLADVADREAQQIIADVAADMRGAHTEELEAA